MSEAPDKDQQTEAPTEKRKREAVEKGDVLQSRELGTALVMLAGAAFFAIAGPMMVGSLKAMLVDGLTFDGSEVKSFAPADTALRLIAFTIVPLAALFAMTLVAAVGSSALIGSLGFRSGAFAPKANKINPMTGLKRIFGMQGLIELVKSLAKVIVLGAVGYYLMKDQLGKLLSLSATEPGPALGAFGETFTTAVLMMALALAAIALVDVPSQWFQRTARLRMSKQQVKEEHKQTEGSPELKAAIRRRQYETLRGSARSAVQEATVILTNPTHFAVALRYRPGEDSAPIVVARGRGATAAAIRELATESGVPMLSYPQLARAIYFTTRVGHIVREDLYLAVATVLAFVFNLDAVVAQGGRQPAIDVPTEARFDENGRAEP
ncbi:flagellar type III secretion system protein FlhB [Sphingoaurantiacus capsulatus]|uniref:Flagellar type III secretion system protein FlhB n=1 Tax=Sphingoaurantiacus capsulatus TaxID=1771310 RepID=A0ABV7XFP2_9SPHN